MTTQQPIDESGTRARVLDALARGLVVAIPTDTVYGVAADPTQPEAVARLFALKDRPEDVPLPVLVGGLEQAEVLAGAFEPAAARLASRFWPGPLTLVVPRRPGFTVDLGGPPSARLTVGIRWPDHEWIKEICAAFGPLAVTSANPHGASPATSAGEVATYFPEAEDLAVIVDGGTCDGTPSTVMECRGPATRCLRAGALSPEMLSAS